MDPRAVVLDDASIGGASPGRADAMVWALWALMLEPQTPVPRLTRF